MDKKIMETAYVTYEIYIKGKFRGDFMWFNKDRAYVIQRAAELYKAQEKDIEVRRAD